jgi:hypothetical protein
LGIELLDCLLFGRSRELTRDGMQSDVFLNSEDPRPSAGGLRHSSLTVILRVSTVQASVAYPSEIDNPGKARFCLLSLLPKST